jgi:hypothetical protein
MGSAEWRMESEELEMRNGEWRMRNEEWIDKNVIPNLFWNLLRCIPPLEIAAGKFNR